MLESVILHLFDPALVDLGGFVPPRVRRPDYDTSWCDCPAMQCGHEQDIAGGRQVKKLLLSQCDHWERITV